LNLDGGGSTSLVVNSTKTVRPGDNGVERPVVSAVLIKRK
jgi:exopolysaccharide biosynthesis protein